MQTSHFIRGIYRVLIHKYISKVASKNYNKSNFKYKSGEIAEDIETVSSFV